ncbi:nitrilase-related carbon-nitrogen hydrolase [Bacillus sp. UNC438CL73TsuS30]|uniref:nitrilase-related carbon-nitrogen hydrolase n=1 Tax=Bacillus sp. UNC438CL73TsuS30 TaxID=1340434 RepID=UPI00047A3D60|nr:nitrilase-related carbon-nitrogen hydrolase [Bacillus sp. UNC438CL73TsuS30]
MKLVKISVCQFKLEPVSSFKEFENQVNALLKDVPSDSDYVLFPESFTVGLLTVFPDFNELEVKEVTRIDEFTQQYKNFFSRLANDRKQVIIGGSHLERRGDNYFNIAYIFKQDGTYVGHKKTHIFPAEADWGTKEGDQIEVFDIGPAKIGVAICYEAEIPEVSHILSQNGAEIIFCPSYTITEHGFWRVRHCAQSRCIENQVYFVHCPTVGEIGGPVGKGYGRASILSPCDSAWPDTGVITEAETNCSMVITGIVDLDELYENRKNGAATTFKDRQRRKELYLKYKPYKEQEINI